MHREVAMMKSKIVKQLGILVMLLAVSGVLFGCESKSESVAVPPSAEKTFTLEELKTYNGEDGALAYVAVDGVVYDVTQSKLWANGKHNGNIAGKDLSEAINKSPHGKGKLKNLPIVGKLTD